MSADTTALLDAGRAAHETTEAEHRRHATALTLPLRDRFTLGDSEAGAIRDVLNRPANRPVAAAVVTEILANGTRPDQLAVQRACRRHIDADPNTSTTCPQCDGTLWVSTAEIEAHGTSYSAVTKCPRCWAGER